MDKDIRNKLIIILKLFKDKPEYLIKFLLDNNAFSEDFLLKVYDSIELERLNNLQDSYGEDEFDIFSEIPHFKTINGMNNYFKNIISNGENLEEDNIYEKINKDLEQSMIESLKIAIKEQRFEDASELRDRMRELNIKFDKFL